MKEIIEKLRQSGCNIDIAMERFLNDEEMYVQSVDEVLTDKAFDELHDALIQNNISDAFDASHTLKGIIAQVELKSLYNIIVDIVEPLRRGDTQGLLEVYDRLIKERDKYIALLASCEKK